MGDERTLAGKLADGGPCKIGWKPVSEELESDARFDLSPLNIATDGSTRVRPGCDPAWPGLTPS